MGWDGMGWDGMGWNGMGWDGMELNGMGWYGMEWNGMGWDGVEWGGVEWSGVLPKPFPSSSPHVLGFAICTQAIRFHASHRFFSRLRNHSTVSLAIPPGV